MRALRPERPLRVQRDDSGARLAERRGQRMQHFSGRAPSGNARPPRRQTSNHEAPVGRQEGLRRPLQLLAIMGSVIRDPDPWSPDHGHNSGDGPVSPQDEADLTSHPRPITKKVDLLLFTQTIGGTESGLIAKQIRGEIASLNDKVAVVEKSFVLDTDDPPDTASTRRRPSSSCPTAPTRASASTARTPATSSSRWSRPCCSPAPAARARARDPGLARGVDKPMHIQVFSTPT